MNQPPENTDASDQESPSRRQRRALATRRSLLDAGLTAIQRQPLALVSVFDITEEADVAKGVFYAHFKSKEEFLLTLWLDVQQQFLAGLKQSIEPQKYLGRRLALAIAHYHEFASCCPRETCYWMRLSSFTGNELGAPGELPRARRNYYEELGSMIPPGNGQHDREAMTGLCRLLDASCWAMLWQAMQLGEAMPKREEMTRCLLPALRAAPMPPRDRSGQTQPDPRGSRTPAARRATLSEDSSAED